MGAGAANMSYGANSMLVQIGDKLQGLPPTTNKRAELIPHIRRRADGDKRNWIFCINQLAGGVGRHAGEFAPGADGVKDCTERPHEHGYELSLATPLFNCDAWYMFAELNTWVTTQLSSMFATMNQTTVDPNNPNFYNYLGLTLLPASVFNGSIDAGASFTSGKTYNQTFSNYALAIDALLDNSLWLDVTLGQVPNFDLTPFGTTAPSSTTLDVLSGPGTGGNALALRTAITNNLNDPANANVLSTLTDLFGKTFHIPGYSGNLRYAVYIFPENFVQGAVMSNMVTWIQAAQAVNDRGASQWGNYYTSNGGSANGLTFAVATKYGGGVGLMPNIRMCKLQNVCDTDQVSVIGASASAPGTISSNVGPAYPLSGDITTTYIVQE